MIKVHLLRIRYLICHIFSLNLKVGDRINIKYFPFTNYNLRIIVKDTDKYKGPLPAIRLKRVKELYVLSSIKIEKEL